MKYEFQQWVGEEIGLIAFLVLNISWYLFVFNVIGWISVSYWVVFLPIYGTYLVFTYWIFVLIIVNK